MGAARPGGADESGFDLFDRWLAHRDQQANDVAGSNLGPADASDVDAVALESPLFVDTSVDLGVPADQLLVATSPEPPAVTPAAPSTSAPASGAGTPVERPEHGAARAVLAALAADRPSPATAPDPGAPTAETERTAAPRAGTADPPPAAPVSSSAGPAATAAPLPPVVEFARRRGARRVVGLLLLASLGATVAASYVAYQDRSTPSIGIAAALAVLAAVVWAVRAGSEETTVTVRGGEVEIVRGGSRHRFDLASHYTPVDVVGQPGSRTWKVLFHRRSMAPYVVDASMVDPVEFTRLVRHYRPTPE